MLGFQATFGGIPSAWQPLWTVSRWTQHTLTLHCPQLTVSITIFLEVHGSPLATWQTQVEDTLSGAISTNMLAYDMWLAITPIIKGISKQNVVKPGVSNFKHGPAKPIVAGNLLQIYLSDLSDWLKHTLYNQVYTLKKAFKTQQN